MTKSQIIKNICILHNIDETYFNYFMKEFHNHIKSYIRRYKNISGLTDFRMNSKDYYILYQLYINTKYRDDKIEMILIFMYSFYKLDIINYDLETFPMNSFFSFLNENPNIHRMIFKLIK